MADLAGLDQLGHRADGVLDRHCRVDTMLVVQVDVVGLQARQRSVTGGPDVLGPAVDADPGSVEAPLVPELGGDHYLVPPPGDRLADKDFIRERAVHVGGVEEIAAELQGPVNRRDGLSLVAGAVELRHAHAPEAEGGNFQ